MFVVRCKVTAGFSTWGEAQDRSGADGLLATSTWGPALQPGRVTPLTSVKVEASS